MEPVTILGVVGNSIQLVDFVGKLVSKTQHIHRNGSLVEHNDLQYIGRDLAQLSNKLKQDISSSGSALAENDSGLYDTSTKCLDIAAEIKTALAKMDVKGSSGKWKSFRQALKAIWGAEKLKELQERLDMFSQQLQRRMQAKTHESVVQLRVDIIAAIDTSSDNAAREHELTRGDILSLRKEAEQQAEQLREELQNVKQELEKCIREVVAGSQQASKSERKKLQELTNATYNLWAAKEIMLKNILDYISTFRESKTDPPSSPSPEPLRIQPYPTTQARKSVSDKIDIVPFDPTWSSGLSSNEGVSPALTNSATEVQLWYPIAARNIAMLKHCLENGADVNAMYTPDMDAERASPLLRMPPLIAALIQEHDDRAETVRLLLENGADPTATDNGGTSAYKYAVRSEDPETIKAMVEALDNASKQPEIQPKMSRFDRKVTRGGTKPLCWDTALAIIRGETACIASFLSDERGISTALKTACLHLAVIFDNGLAGGLLHAHGISAFERHSFPSTPIEIALRKQSNLIQTFLDDGSDGLPMDCFWYSHPWQDSYWFSHLFLDTPEFYPNPAIINMILNTIPLIDAFKYAIEHKDNAWIHRIAMRIAPRLLKLPDESDEPQEVHIIQRSEFWTLMEKAFDECSYHKWIFEVPVSRYAFYVEGLSTVFADKVLKIVELQKEAHGIDKRVADLGYVLRAHIARGKMQSKR